MSPEMIRILLASSQSNLPRLAKRMELPLPIARDMRVQAINLVLGRCVLCGKPTLAGMCGYCKKVAPHRRLIPWSSKSFLKMLNPSDQLLRQTCSSCGKEFMLSASFLLRRLSTNKGRETCRGCYEKAQRLRELEARKLEALNKRPQPKPRPANLFQRPFKESEILQNLRAEMKKSQKPPKRHMKTLKSPKRAKIVKNQLLSR